jgi:preprotein translocase subunit SecY
MSLIDVLITKLPGVNGPPGYLNFSSRMKWTGLILFIFLLMGQITLWGISPGAHQQFQTFELILGSSIGSLVTLGIGPIVTASIILQILAGSKVINIDTSTEEGKAKFQGMQKLLAIFFALFEAIAFVSFGAVQPANGELVTFVFLIFQLMSGALILLFLDEIVSKWGIGSGISLFIAAGVSKTIFVRALNPIIPEGSNIAFGLIPTTIQYLTSQSFYAAFTTFLPIIATIIVFLIVVYAQAMKVEIPLAMGSVRGFAMKWPLKLIYTSNIPVILIAALLANIQLIAGAMATTVSNGLRCGLLGCFDAQNQAISGIVYFLQPPLEPAIQFFFIVFLAIILISIVTAYYIRYSHIGRVLIGSAITGIILAGILMFLVTGPPGMESVIRIITYFVILVAGSVLFSTLWVSTSSMDASSVAKQIQGMGMQVPGFRRDPRIVEQVLNRYIPSLTIISGMFIGTLAALADFTGALGTGTGILLTVMILFNFYEQISQKYVEDMNPAVRKYFE